VGGTGKANVDWIGSGPYSSAAASSAPLSSDSAALASSAAALAAAFSSFAFSLVSRSSCFFLSLSSLIELSISSFLVVFSVS
jgi:hypothetical protein